jgi:hypothetical protein
MKTMQQRIDDTSLVVMDMFYGMLNALECWDDIKGDLDDIELYKGYITQELVNIQSLVTALQLQNKNWVTISKVMEWEDCEDVIEYAIKY